MSSFKIEFSMPLGTRFRKLSAIISALAIRLRSGETDGLCSSRRNKSRIESPLAVSRAYQVTDDCGNRNDARRQQTVGRMLVTPF